MIIFATCTWGENDRAILRMSTKAEDCHALIDQIRADHKRNNFKFFPENYWVEPIIIKDGVFWESD